VFEDVSFTSNDGVGLVGSLAVPRRGAVGRPGLVLVGGSGPSDRHNGGLFDDIHRHLVAAGIVVLAYDKRGAGGSSGEWAAADVDLLAADAAAALTVLRNHPAVSSESVGLLGHSEGGWVALRVAARLIPPAHLILNSCPAVSFARAEVYGQTKAGVEEKVAAGTVERLADLAAAGGSHSQARRTLMDGADEATRAALAARPSPRTTSS
jgi:pimeloyl-ACP methyl ester carboxylesterase